jgi:hypothetical protein
MKIMDLTRPACHRNGVDVRDRLAIAKGFAEAGAAVVTVEPARMSSKQRSATTGGGSSTPMS